MPAPDVFVVRREDWKAACQLDEYLEEPPLLVVEIQSPANRKAKVTQKIEIYLGHGVKAVWVVSAMKRSLHLHSGVDDQRRVVALGEEAMVTLPEPLAGGIWIRDMFVID